MPGITCGLKARPVSVKANETQEVIFTVALTGRDDACLYTQGAATLYPGLCRSWAFSPPSLTVFLYHLSFCRH